jgi:GNAT superfamily N-acetyltransferase
VVELVAAAVEELADRNGGEGHGPYPVGPSCRFVVVTVDGEAAGCGAIQPLDDQTVEVKWMYVTPAHRGNGLARRLLAALEDLAAGAHYPVVRLQTGVNQPKAIALYESAGYRQVPSYGPYIDNPYSRCYEKLIIDSESIALGSA